ncbi:MAG TPA: DUF2203 domain-containing protein [Nitrosopumilaceae archaeon]|nr:DUF2203 domain-containing protein [Nitrosopumilaceae archaeon]
MFSYFTIKDANEILPVVIKKFKNILNIKNEVFKIQSEMENNPKYMSSFQDYVIKKQELNSALSNFYKSIEDLEKMGVMLKSVDEGLLDFPSQRFEEEVWLCWKEGETEIKFWHGKDEGFMGRKPLSVSDESLV